MISQTTLYPIHHAEAVKAANQEALTRAALDSATGCSLSKEDLFLFHFAKMYPAHLVAQKKKAGSTHYNEILQRMEDNKEYRDKCCDHCRDAWHFSRMPKTKPEWWTLGDDMWRETYED